ncbi:MAG: TIGR03546 family protein [Spirochaetaceae bacterium]
MIIKWIAKLVIAINSNTRPLHLALAIAFAFWAAMVPPSLVWFLLIIFVFFIKVNHSIFMVFLAIFSLITKYLDEIRHSIGLYVLQMDQLYDFFVKLKNTPIIAFSQFDYTIVFGGFLFGIACFIPVTIISTILVKVYRKFIRDKIANSKIVKAFVKSPIIAKIIKAVSNTREAYTKIA